MSTFRPFPPTTYGSGNLYAPLSNGGLGGRRRVFVQYNDHPPEAPKVPAKHHHLRNLLLTGTAIALSALVFKKISPEYYAKTAETIGKYTPGVVKDAKTYLATQAENLKSHSLVQSALRKAEPLTHVFKNQWKKWLG